MKIQPAILAAIGAAILLSVMSVFTVDERDLAVKFRFGEIVDTGYAPGLHLMIPFVNRGDSLLSLCFDTPLIVIAG